MKLLLVLSVLCQLGQTVAKDPSPEEFASQLYQKASEKVASFFKTAGTPVADYAHPSLRTEVADRHPRATAHFTYYRDDKCTEINSIIDYKSRCLNPLGNETVHVVSEQDSTWTLTFYQFDNACENYFGMGFEDFPQEFMFLW
jgi:glucuronate isomerase